MIPSLLLRSLIYPSANQFQLSPSWFCLMQLQVHHSPPPHLTHWHLIPDTGPSGTESHLACPRNIVVPPFLVCACWFVDVPGLPLPGDQHEADGPQRSLQASSLVQHCSLTKLFKSLGQGTTAHCLYPVGPLASFWTFSSKGQGWLD